MEGTDAEAIKKFVESEDAFGRLSREWFELADKNRDGVLCELEMRKWLESIDFLESDQGVPLHKTEEELRITYRDAFELFDADHNGAVDLQEFSAQLRSMLLAIADGLGGIAVHMLVPEGDTLLGALQKHADIFLHHFD